MIGIYLVAGYLRRRLRAVYVSGDKYTLPDEPPDNGINLSDISAAPAAAAAAVARPTAADNGIITDC